MSVLPETNVGVAAAPGAANERLRHESSVQSVSSSEFLGRGLHDRDLISYKERIPMAQRDLQLSWPSFRDSSLNRNIAG